MHPVPLPVEREALARLQAELRVLLSLGSYEIDRLTRLADRFEGPRPLTISALALGKPVTIGPVGKFAESAACGIIDTFNSGAEVNDSLSEIAKLTLPLLKYLPLSLGDRLHVEQLANADGGSRPGGRGGSSLLLEGMIRFAGDPPLADEIVEANRVRLMALRGLLERLAVAVAELSPRVEKQLYPPEVKDRVKVDVEKRVLTVDGQDYELNTHEQARILEQMAKANGKPLPGPEIARLAGLRADFMVSRTLNQVRKKHPELRRFIPLASDAGNKFCFRLPPLA